MQAEHSALSPLTIKQYLTRITHEAVGLRHDCAAVRPGLSSLMQSRPCATPPQIHMLLGFLSCDQIELDQASSVSLRHQRHHKGTLRTLAFSQQEQTLNTGLD